MPKSKIEDLPKTTGVYLFYTKKDTIYIGKAINIKNRVKNHFNQPSHRDNLFIDKVDKVSYLKTGSEIEALILEAELIKKFQPKFNVMWRDDKNYFYVAISQNKQKIPYIYITHQTNQSKDSSKTIFVGPFTEGVALKKTLRFLRKAFPYYTFAKHSRLKCTYCHLDLCPGVNPDLNDYKRNIKKLVLILKGKKNTALKSLKREMNSASKNQDYEKAKKIRDTIYSLQQIINHAHVINTDFNHDLNTNKQIVLKEFAQRIECYDISNIQGKFATGSMVVFVNKKPDKSQYKKFKIQLPEKPNDIAMLKEVLTRRFSHKEWPLPSAILIDGGKGQLNVAVKIKKIKSLKVKVMALAKGKQELFIEGQNPIPLKQLPQETYNLIKSLDDEAHRFAISYHRSLRNKNLFE